MASNINPSLEPTKSLVNFRFWCQKVLPLVYDDSLSYYEVLGKMVVQLNDVIDDVNADIENVDTLKEAFLALQTYVNEFFDDIDQLASYAERAEAAQTAANTSAINAASSASNASASSLAAMDARDTAVTAKEAAEASANTASEASTNANTKASEAAESATTSQTAATSAANSATAASGSATNAATSAASALQNFQLSDAARVAAQSAADDAEAAAELIDMDATASDVGKAIIVKTVGGGKVTAYEFGEAGGGGGIVNSIENEQIASFDDGTDAPVVELVVGIEPVQSGSGDPAPDNVRPITGWTEANVCGTGVNVWDEDWEVGGIAGGTGLPYDANDRIRSKNFCPCKGSTEYYLKNKTTTTALIIWWYDGNKAFISNGGTNAGKCTSVTSPSNARYFKISSYNGNSTSYANDYSVNYPSTDTDYHAYTGTTYSLTFPTEAGTVYGGTLENHGTDVWKLSVEKIGIAPYIDSFQSINEYNIANFGFNINNAPAAGDGLTAESLCNVLTLQIQPIAQTTTIGYMIANQSAGYLRLDGTTVDTVPKARQWVIDNNCLIVYKLATPVEYTITTSEVVNLLAGYNNVWTDTGGIKLLKYVANGKQYVDEKDSLVKALIAKELDSMIADTTLVANDFRIVNNTLYKITANIASGGTLTPGTNCVATTIGEVLKTLLT